MTDTYYVIYGPTTRMYLNDQGGLGSFDGASQFWSRADAEWTLTEMADSDLKIVGPCIEGEQP